MKLLIGENLSPRLVVAVSDLFPRSVHVRDVDLHSASDQSVWEFARVHGFAIVSKDADFRQRSFLFGAPPKVVWIRRGNCTTEDIEALLRSYHEWIEAFNGNSEEVFLSLA